MYPMYPHKNFPIRESKIHYFFEVYISLYKRYVEKTGYIGYIGYT